MKGMLRDVLGTFVDLPAEPASEAAKAPRPSESTAAAATSVETTAAPTPEAAQAPPPESEEAIDPAVESQIDEALGKVASQQLVAFLELYEQMAFIADPADRARAVLVARSLAAADLLDLFAPQLMAIGKVQASFTGTVETNRAQADALAQSQLDEADAAIAAARDEIAALEARIGDLEREKVVAHARREAAAAESTRIGRMIERACERRRTRLTEVQRVLGHVRNAATSPG